MSGIMQVNTPVESFDVRGAIEHAEKQSNAQSILTVREAIMSTTTPQLILIFSGKRKSGKDYVTDLTHTRLGADACCILRLSGPLKEQYAKEHGLDYSELLGAGQYKEKYRADMIKWGERRREQDPGFFCRLAIREAKQPVWIISDARRLSDVQWFWREFPNECRCVRVEASEQTRLERGWKFTPGIDDAESECGLDQGVPFDWTISNDGDAATLEEQLKELFVLAKNKCADNGHKKTTN